MRLLSFIIVIVLVGFLMVINPDWLDPLYEAAEIDGCSQLEIFVRIILPLIRPALVTAAIFSF